MVAIISHTVFTLINTNNASFTWCILSFFRRICFGQLLYALQKSKALVMGKLLDRWWVIFLAYCSTSGGMDYYSGFFEYHITYKRFNAVLYLSFWIALGNWWTHLWPGSALLRSVIRQQYNSWVMYDIRIPCPIYLLSICSP